MTKICSKSEINKIGDRIRNGTSTPNDAEKFECWRASHRAVLNSFQAILRNRTKHTKILVAQRLKRKNTIINKLKRFPDMKLSRMDDIAGCRLIFKDIKDLERFRKNFHLSRFNHKLINDIDKYDYIKYPKNSGYRGIHDVYSYNVNSKQGEALEGLKIELQYRTSIQHYWATTVEVIGLITENQPKFQSGDDRYTRIMALASELLARVYEDSKGPFPDLSNHDLVNQFMKIEKDLNLLYKLESISIKQEKVRDNNSYNNKILIFNKNSKLRVENFKYAPQAIKKLFEVEKEYPDADIVFIKVKDLKDARKAYSNYFANTREFTKRIRIATNVLSSGRSEACN